MLFCTCYTLKIIALRTKLITLTSTYIRAHQGVNEQGPLPSVFVYQLVCHITRYVGTSVRKISCDIILVYSVSSQERFLSAFA